MINQPDQDVYDAIYRACLSNGYTVADNPEKELTVPFVDIGVIEIIPNPTKTGLKGSVVAYFNVYGDWTQRKRVSDIASNILRDLSKLNYTQGGYRIGIEYRETSVAVRRDVHPNSENWVADVRTHFNLY